MRFWLLVLLGLVTGRVYAQESVSEVSGKQPWIYGTYAHGGFILAHSPFMRHLAVSHPTGLELNIQKQTMGQKAWHQLYDFPKIGYNLVYFNYHNPALGHSVAASTYVNKSLLKTKSGELNYRLGVGLAYLTTIYNQETNNKNSVASSAFNATMHTRFEYDYRITPHFSFLLGLGLNHYSNGAIQKPNQGLNIPTLSLGLNYHTVSEVVTQNQPLPEFSPELHYTLSSTAGLRQLNILTPRKFLVQSLTAAVIKPLNRKSNVVLGAEIFHDRSLKIQQQTDTALTGKPFPDTKKGGLYVGHELLFGDLVFETQLGYYIYRPYKAGTAYYERLGMKYHFTPNVFGGLGLKIHGFAADVIECRVGYRF